MKARTIAEFGCDFPDPVLFVDPLHDTDLDTLRGQGSYDSGLRGSLRDTIGERQTSDQLVFADTPKSFSNDWLLDRYKDATNGADPGKPWIKSETYDPDTPLEETTGYNADEIEFRLERFFRQTKLHPPRHSRTISEGSDIQDKGSWGGVTEKLNANIRMPEGDTRARSFLHELGHCAMGEISFSLETSTKLTTDNVNSYPISRNYDVLTHGLHYKASNGETRGIILEESVAEALGSLTNKKLGIVLETDPSPNIPDTLKPYIINGASPFSAPGALSLELIADEIGIPFERYLHMYVDYANAGVHNVDARQEVAETIYKGTRGKLTMAQIEGLPYPANPRASLALLWAVESALEIPDHARYSQHFARY